MDEVPVRRFCWSICEYAYNAIHQEDPFVLIPIKTNIIEDGITYPIIRTTIFYSNIRVTFNKNKLFETILIIARRHMKDALSNDDYIVYVSIGLQGP